ncbi:MAG: biopolymer transporter ExbD [Nitrospira sp.]|nr:biopolymer transporter ExbD [Nitrospira sp.]HBP89751.1 protein TolR [Nitrospiraceae bacterium]HNP30184.1 biopolymer transporter ExbD [Nitrospirales bacterium]
MTIGSKPRQFLSEINVIPLVDVVLVLLVIFMVTAPMLHRGLDINLPTTAANNIKAEERLIVTIQRDHTLSLGNDTISLVNLRAKLQEAKASNPLISVYLRADQTVPYGTVVQVMDEVKGAKIERLGMITGPKIETIIEDETIGVSR